jgi:alkylhydroperoxidase family enzyme
VARIPYPNLDQPELAPLARKIEGERGKVLNLYRMLLQSPPVAEGWLGFLTAIRQKCQLSGRARELAIMRVAVLNGADYEFKSHTPFALQEGIDAAQIEALREGRLEAFEGADRSVLAYCDSMTRDIRVPEPVFAAVKAHFSEREVVELTATIAAYNLVSRFLEALQIDHDD